MFTYIKIACILFTNTRQDQYLQNRKHFRESFKLCWFMFFLPSSYPLADKNPFAVYFVLL